MSDAAPFLAAIRAAPDDDAPRLIYADWLDEHGQPERAEFIRVQCELARRESPELRNREAELLAEHHDALAGPLAAPHLQFRFDRGFIAGFGHTGIFGALNVEGSTYMTRTMLRFHPTGRFEKASLVDRSAGASAFFRGDDPYHFRGSYRVELAHEQLRIRLEFRGDPQWSHHGSFDALHRVLVIRRRIHPLASQEYEHILIPNLDSFQES